MNNYSISTQSMNSFNATVEAVKTALKEEGFGVLTEIDIQEKMKTKLDKDMRPYLILGACHPPSAFEAIQMEAEIGLFLPCNVIVYESEDGHIQVGAVRPSVAMAMIDNPGLGELAKRIETSLEKAINKIK